MAAESANPVAGDTTTTHVNEGMLETLRTGVRFPAAPLVNRLIIHRFLPTCNSTCNTTPRRLLRFHVLMMTAGPFHHRIFSFAISAHRLAQAVRPFLGVWVQTSSKSFLAPSIRSHIGEGRWHQL